MEEVKKKKERGKREKLLLSARLLTGDKMIAHCSKLVWSIDMQLKGRSSESINYRKISTTQVHPRCKVW